MFSEKGIHPTGYFSRENFDMPIRSLGAILSDKPTLWLGFSGAMFHAIQGVVGCSWQKVPMIFQQSALRCHILRNPRRRLGHVTYLPDHQRQRVLDGIYDSWIQPGSWIPGGLNGRGQGDTSLACPPWSKEDEGVGVAP